jgi:lipoate-protein ligase B
MVPCGIAEVQMTSIEREVGESATLGERTRELVQCAFAELFALEAVAITPAELDDCRPEPSEGPVLAGEMQALR